MIADGKKISSEILSDLRKDVAGFSFRPKLIDIYAGENSVVESYVKIKGKRAEELGMEFEAIHFSESAGQEEIKGKIRSLNLQKEICGIIVQLPLPAHLDKQDILDAIDPKLDIDAIGSHNRDLFFKGKGYFIPPTAGAIMAILDYYKIEIGGKKVLVIGEGELVGKPAAILLRSKGAKVSSANLQTQNLKELCLDSDIIIAGAGSPKIVRAGMVKRGAVVIDAGTSESGGAIYGDVDFENVAPKCALISPVPGGVGPITVAILLKNALKALKLRRA